MLTVALIGPDGAGKTTIGRRLERSLGRPVKYLYMGVNADASNVALPTTRLLHALRRAAGAAPDRAGPRDPSQPRKQSKKWIVRRLSGLKSWLSLGNRISEEWFRQILASYHKRQGTVVLFDRHYFCDYYIYDVARTSPSATAARSWSSRLHGWMLRRFYPQPDLVIYLDAPGHVLFARKGEGSPELLERRRHDYLSLRDVAPRFVVVNVDQPLEKVEQEARQHILDYTEQKQSSGPLEAETVR